MKIVKAIVTGELPTDCEQCPFIVVSVTWSQDADRQDWCRKCRLNNRELDDRDKPDWCPLVTETITNEV